MYNVQFVQFVQLFVQKSIICTMASHLFCTSNHMFGRGILDKLPGYIFENFEIAQVKRGQFQDPQKSRG